MRRLAAALLALLAGCGEAPAPPAPQPRATPSPAPPAPVPPANAAEPPPGSLPDESGLADMSPRQRRAYEAGRRDCAAGRYEPDPHSEAYRIGCAAAQE